MRLAPIKSLVLTAFLGLFLTIQLVKAQSPTVRQAFDYTELKGLLSKHGSTVSSMLSMKRFKLISSKEKPESTIHAYKKESGSTQLLIRIRKSDGLVSEVAWNENLETLGSLTHDAVHDGFVPVAGNSQYYNRFQNRALFINYQLADDDDIIPCILKSVQ